MVSSSGGLGKLVDLFVSGQGPLIDHNNADTHIGQHGFQFVITSYGDSVAHLVFVCETQSR